MSAHDWFITVFATLVWTHAALSFAALWFPPDAAAAPGPGQSPVAWRIRRVLHAIIGTHRRQFNVPSPRWWYLAQALNYTGLGLIIARPPQSTAGSLAVLIAAITLIIACATVLGIGSLIEWRRAQAKIAEIQQRLRAEGLQ